MKPLGVCLQHSINIELHSALNSGNEAHSSPFFLVCIPKSQQLQQS